MKVEHIEIIRRQFGVSLASISQYNSDHTDEIKNISDIFYLKGDSKKKVLALLYMLSLSEEDDGEKNNWEEDEAVKRYRKETGLNNDECDSKSLLEQYKVPLLTAMVYNRPFYAMAMNYRGFVNAGLAIGEVEKDAFSGGLHLVKPDEDKNRQYPSRILPKSKYRISDEIAAAPANTGENKFSDISFE